MTYIKLHGVSFGYAPDNLILKDIHLSLSTGVWAIAGPNGAGKTTLLRLIARELEPLNGQVYLPDGADFAWLPQGVSLTGMQRPFSSGEAKMQMLRQVLQQDTDILLLDEPETHLDAANRQWLKRHIGAKQRVVLMVSHDAELLNIATRILHVEQQTVRVFDSHYDTYREKLAHDLQIRSATASRAERVAKFEQRQMQRTLERQERRSRNAARRAPDAGIPRVALGLMKRNAEKTAGKLEAHARQRMRELGVQIADARRQVSHRLDLQFAFAHAMPTRSQVRLEVAHLQLYTERGQPMWRDDVSFAARAGDRICLTGKNGAGKSLLMQHLCGISPLQSRGRVTQSAHERLFLGRFAEFGHGAQNILQMARSRMSTLNDGELRRMLGGFGYWGDRVFDEANKLSAGERMRLDILLSTVTETQPGYCLFDEAEIGLDAGTRSAAASFLRGFGGVVLFASHDEEFVRQIMPTEVISLERA